MLYLSPEYANLGVVIVISRIVAIHVSHSAKPVFLVHCPRLWSRKAIWEVVWCSSCKFVLLFIMFSVILYYKQLLWLLFHFIFEKNSIIFWPLIVYYLVTTITYIFVSTSCHCKHYFITNLSGYSTCISRHVCVQCPKL